MLQEREDAQVPGVPGGRQGKRCQRFPAHAPLPSPAATRPALAHGPVHAQTLRERFGLPPTAVLHDSYM